MPELRRRDRRGRRIAAAVLLTAAAVLLLVLVLRLDGAVAVAWFIPAMDIAAIVCALAVAVLAVVDARLRGDTRSLPLATLGVALSILWMAHVVVFPGDVPGLGGQTFNRATVWIYLLVNIVMPSLLAVAALREPRAVPAGGRSAVRAVVIGAALGLALLALAFALSFSGLNTVNGDTFGELDALVGIVGLLPAALALALIVLGRWSDERVVNGVVAALVLSAINSFLLVFLRSRYTPIWYAVHVLPVGIAAALLAGELSLYARSVRAELRAAARMEASLAVAEAVVSSLHPDVVIGRLLDGGMAAVEADAALLCSVRGDDLVVEGGRPVDRPLRPTGEVLPLAAMPYVEAAVRNRRVELAGGVAGPDVEAGVGEGDRHAMAVPLVFDADVLGVLALARAGGDPFDRDDVTAVRTIANVATLALRNARQFAAVEEVSRAKSLFLNLAAHELRTPISVVRGYTSMLRDGSLGALSPDVSTAVSILQSKSDELSRLVEDILMASRLEAGSVRPQVRAADLRRAVQDAVARLAPSGELRGADIGVDLPPDAVPITADRDYVARILDNLLVNALTYSVGRPWIRVRVSTLGDMAVVAVEDRGVGLQPQDHERVFGRFERVDHAELGFPAGTGLGLYLGRSLAEALGGGLHLERSEPGRGSRFVLHLPLAVPPEQAPAVAEEASQPPPAPRRAEDGPPIDGLTPEPAR